MDIIFTPDAELVKKLTKKSNIIPFPRTEQMGDRFYQQQLEFLGDCPGNKQPKRKRRVAWTDEKRAEAVELYTKEDPTPETSMEIVRMVADQLEESPNGVRMILTKEGVYIKKTPPKSNGGMGVTSTRISKAVAVEDLAVAISDLGQDVDGEILSKLTGKAAVYFTSILQAVNN